MKSLLFIALTLITSSSFAAKVLDHPYEMESFKIEYINSSKRGVITAIGCTYCDKTTYEFKGDIEVINKGKKVPLNKLLKEYSNANYPTIFIDPKSGYAIRIVY